MDAESIPINFGDCKAPIENITQKITLGHLNIFDLQYD